MAEVEPVCRDCISSTKNASIGNSGPGAVAVAVQNLLWTNAACRLTRCLHPDSCIRLHQRGVCFGVSSREIELAQLTLHYCGGASGSGGCPVPRNLNPNATAYLHIRQNPQKSSKISAHEPQPSLERFESCFMPFQQFMRLSLKTESTDLCL